jgi:gliding motility-associated-like protein
VNDIPKIDFDRTQISKQIIGILPAGLKNYEFSVKDEIKQSGTQNTYYYGGNSPIPDRIKIVATNNSNCDTTAVFMVTPPTPDAFTPNGDGINDLLLPGWHIIVFDRTQKVLYDGTNGWDGRYNGKEMPIGTYFYVLYDWNDILVYKGPVTLIRESINR